MPNSLTRVRRMKKIIPMKFLAIARVKQNARSASRVRRTEQCPIPAIFGPPSPVSALLHVKIPVKLSNSASSASPKVAHFLLKLKLYTEFRYPLIYLK